jgi:putative Mn2+ efflux pump MntP
LGFLEILLIALGLAMDAFAVSIAAAAAGRASSPRPIFRLAFHFGLFQFLMPVLGWLLGTQIAHFIAAFDHWIAFVLLALVGVRMIRSGCATEPTLQVAEPSRGWTLIMLSIATSIDALAIGLSLAMLQVNIWYPAAVIGVVTALLSLVGVRLGCSLGLRFGKPMEILGGIILIGIGLKILVEHLSA